MSNRLSIFPYPYYVLTEDHPQISLPRNETHYILASNGVFIHKGSTDLQDKNSGLIESVTKVTGFQQSVNLPGLVPCETYANVRVTKFPHKLAVTCQRFFSRVLRELSGESEIQLYYSQDIREFRLECPQQQVSHGGVEYVRDLNGIFNTGNVKFARAGTIHSHCDFEAFHSGTDQDDEKHEDGLHITFGHVDKPDHGEPLSVVVSVVSNNHRFQMNPEHCIEGISFSSEKAEKGLWKKGNNTEKYYHLDSLSQDEEAEISRQVDEWMPRVSVATYQRNKRSNRNTSRSGWTDKFIGG